MNYICAMVYLIGAWTGFQFLEGILAASADIEATIHNLAGLAFTIALFVLMMKCQNHGDCKAKKAD